MNRKHAIIPIFVPHKGCPNDCIFCNQKRISGQIRDLHPEEIPEIIDKHLNTITTDPFIEIAFYGGSFTAIDTDLQEHYLSQAYKYIKSGKASEIRLSTRPDKIDKKILSMLKEYGVRTIELGVQSLDDDVLKASCRGHDSSVVYSSAELIKRAGFRLGIQTMTGLPKDTAKKCLDTARKVISMSPELVRIYPVLVIKGTGLERLMENGEYTPQSLEEAIDICAQLLRLYEENNIRVIRAGLQNTDNIRQGDGSDVVAGPVHPAFRQLAESKLSLIKTEEIIMSLGHVEASNLIIRTGVSNISNVVGQNKANINYLKDRYGFKNIKVMPADDMLREIACTVMSSATFP